MRSHGLWMPTPTAFVVAQPEEDDGQVEGAAPRQTQAGAKLGSPQEVPKEEVARGQTQAAAPRTISSSSPTSFA